MEFDLNTVAKRLSDRGFLVDVCKTPEEAKKLILGYIGERSSPPVLWKLLLTACVPMKR